MKINKAYKVVKNDDIFFLEVEVKELLKEGWKTCGGVMFANGFFYQAMEYNCIEN